MPVSPTEIKGELVPIIPYVSKIALEGVLYAARAAIPGSWEEGVSLGAEVVKRSGWDFQESLLDLSTMI